MRSCLPVLSASLLTFLVTAADDSPQFLGPDRTGVSSETGLVDTFTPAGPEILWRTPLGPGMSGISVDDTRAYTMFQDEERQYAVAVDVSSGDIAWKTNVAGNYENSMGNGPRATPTVADGVVYVFTGEGILVAISANDGRIIWSVNTIGQIGGRSADYGMSSSPLLVEDGVIVHVGSPNGCVCCFHKDSGELKWKAGNELSGYSSSIRARLAGRSQVVSLTGADVMGIDPETGHVLWSYPFETEYNCNTANPVVLGESSVLISAGENHGSVVLNLKAEGEQVTVSEGWSSLGKDSVLRAEWQTPVLSNGILYGLDNIGSAGPITNLVAVDASTGKQLWMKKRFGKGNLLLADNKLFMTTMRGELIIGTATPEDFTETARFVVTGMTRQAPVISNGRLFMRDDKEIACLQISKPR